MFIIIHLACLVYIINQCNAMPMSESLKSNNSNIKDRNTNTNGNGMGYMDIIDLSGLGIKAYGVPNKESGEAVASWSESSLVNPEELGEYFEGDILMPPVILRNGLINLSSRWTDAIVPYDFEGSFSEEEKNLIVEAMNQFHSFTCVRFVPYDGQMDYLGITNDAIGCSSAIGRLGGRQTINLSPPCMKYGTIIHELMHTIGFLHEITREDRNDYITVVEGNIQDGRLEDFMAYQSNTFGVPYDYGSIMHHSEYALAKGPNMKTIVAKKNYNGVTLGQRKRLSQGDIEKINIMYKCQI